MEEILIKAAQFILSLSILIVLHEFGHFIPARLFGTRVEKFYLFFNPKFSIVKKKIGDTEWGIGWIPLGGYVKIAGMIDESMDKEQLAKPAEPWEFRSKPAWQRLIIMLGGVIVNVIVGFVIYVMIAGVWGNDRIDPTQMTLGVQVDSTMMAAGIHNGDKILTLEGVRVNSLSRVNEDIMFLGQRNLTVEREGNEIAIELPEDIDYDLIKGGARMPFSFFTSPIVSELEEDSKGLDAGMKVGDSVVSIDGTPIEYSHEFLSEVKKIDTGIMFDIIFYRDDIKDTVTVGKNENGLLGVHIGSKVSYNHTVIHDDYSFTEAFPAGMDIGKRKIASYFFSMKHIFTKAGVTQMGGFISMGKQFSPTWDWHRFWGFTAFLSLVLAVMNILPIPALDGGHVLFLLYEMITGREPNKKFLEYAQVVGMVLLLGLLLYANGNDVFKWITGK
jgi:regulator of sigma E protease